MLQFISAAPRCLSRLPSMPDAHLELEIAGVVFGQSMPDVNVKNCKCAVPVVIRYPDWSASSCTEEIPLCKTTAPGQMVIDTWAFYLPSFASC